MKLKINTILMGDAYKYTHWLQYPKRTTKIYAYGESRGTKLNIPYTVFFGLQGFIKDYLEGVVLERWMIDEAKELLGEVFGTHEYFNEKGFLGLIEKHGGRLPIKIRAIREGRKVTLKNVLFVIENTDDEFAWVVQWIETMLLRAVWYPKSVATISSAVRDIEKKYAAICGCSLNPFFLNDFGARGVSSHESAEIGGAAALVTYMGTDTIEGIRWTKHNYGKIATGYSVFATEHSTTTTYGKTNEIEAYRNALTVAPKDKIVSLVIDSYDAKNAVKNLIGGDELRNIILNVRIAPTVIRPDSGDPVEMALNVIMWLWEKFGGTVNEKGFKVLNPKIRCIYGDGINLNSIDEILQNLINNRYSSENIIFGMGGKLLQGVDRDTFQDACKVSFAIIDGIEYEIFKDPGENTGKKSKRGKFKVVTRNGSLTTVQEKEYPELPDELVLIFENGKLFNEITFDEVRKNVTLPV